MPFLMQHDRMSGNTGTTATLDFEPMVPVSKVNARIRTLGKLEPNKLLAVIDTEYMVNGFKSLITCEKIERTNQLVEVRVIQTLVYIPLSLNRLERSH